MEGLKAVLADEGGEKAGEEGVVMSWRRTGVVSALVKKWRAEMTHRRCWMLV